MDKKLNPDYSIIICTYNRERFIGETLDSVSGLDFDQSRLELLLIDNNSTDQTPQICRDFQSKNPAYPFRYVTEIQQGLSFARNRGIQEASGNILLFLDDDIFIDKDYLNHVDSMFRMYPETAAFGTRIIVHYENSEPAWMSHYLRPLLGEHNLGLKVLEYRSGRYPFGGSMGIKKELFESIDGFDTRIGRSGNTLGGNEEKALFDIIQRKGYIIRYIPDAVLYHRIDDQRLSMDYVRRQAVGIGYSDHIRIRSMTLRDRGFRYTHELVKIIATLLLSLYHLIKLEPERSNMLIRFRWWVFMGLIGRMKP
jgi:glucosyl-dolichyl phosphate glucuronosyltransferase